MDLVAFRETGRDSASHSPTPACAPIGMVKRRLAEAMNASEQMYFLGAPLAHVAHYENRLRAARCDKWVREVARSCPALNFHAQVALSAARDAADQAGGANDA